MATKTQRKLLRVALRSAKNGLIGAVQHKTVGTSYLQPEMRLRVRLGRKVSGGLPSLGKNR